MRIPKACQQENVYSHKYLFPSDITSLLSQLRQSEIDLLNEELWADFFYKNGECRSRKRVADKLGYEDEKTISRAVKRLEELQLISVVRAHKKPNRIKISSIFKNPYLRKAFACFLPNIIYIPILFHVSVLISSGADLQTNVPQINLSNIYINSLYTDTTKKGESSMSVSNTNEKKNYAELSWVSATTNTSQLFDEAMSDNEYYATKKKYKNSVNTRQSYPKIQKETKKINNGKDDNSSALSKPSSGVPNVKQTNQLLRARLIPKIDDVSNWNATLEKTKEDNLLAAGRALMGDYLYRCIENTTGTG